MLAFPAVIRNPNLKKNIEKIMNVQKVVTRWESSLIDLKYEGMRNIS